MVLDRVLNAGAVIEVCAFIKLKKWKEKQNKTRGGGGVLFRVHVDHDPTTLSQVITQLSSHTTTDTIKHYADEKEKM